MEVTSKYKVYILAEYKMLTNEAMKKRMEKQLSKNIVVYPFKTPELCLAEIENVEQKPDVVVLYHKLNKRKDGNPNALHTMDLIKRISPNSKIIIVSQKKEM